MARLQVSVPGHAVTSATESNPGFANPKTVNWLYSATTFLFGTNRIKNPWLEVIRRSSLARASTVLARCLANADEISPSGTRTYTPEYSFCFCTNTFDLFQRANSSVVGSASLYSGTFLN